MRAVLVALLLLAAATRLSSADPVLVPDLGGRWDGGNGWGIVVLNRTASGDGYAGTYTGTYGMAVGRINLTYSPQRNTFVGHWNEGRYRAGTLVVRIGTDRHVATGNWSTSSTCEFQPGIPMNVVFRWTRPAK